MPDIKTKAEYAQYEANVDAFIKRENLSYISTGTDTKPEEEGGSPDPWFSWSPCECCGCGLGGNREYLFAWSGDTRVQFEICEDCVYYLNYGKLDDTTILRIEDSK